MLDQVASTLNNPVVAAGLRLVAPELVWGVQAMQLVFGGRRRRPSAKKVLVVLDKRLSELITELSRPRSDAHRKELEIRIHEILHVLQEWDKLS